MRHGGVSRDGARLWQIGITVLPVPGPGLAANLTALIRDELPPGISSPSTARPRAIISQNVAISAGFRPVRISVRAENPAPTQSGVGVAHPARSPQKGSRLMAELVWDTTGRLLHQGRRRRSTPSWCPRCSPCISPCWEHHADRGLQGEMLCTTGKSILDYGQKYVHNDACFPRFWSSASSSTR